MRAIGRGRRGLVTNTAVVYTSRGSLSSLLPAGTSTLGWATPGPTPQVGQLLVGHDVILSLGGRGARVLPRCVPLFDLTRDCLLTQLFVRLGAMDVTFSVW